MTRLPMKRTQAVNQMPAAIRAQTMTGRPR